MTPSIRTYLLSLVAALAIPLAATVGYGIYRELESSVHRTKASLRILVEVVAKNAGSKVAGARETLERLATRPAVRAVDESHCDDVLDDLHTLHPGFSNIVYTDMEGKAICSAVPQPGGKPVNVGQAPWFKRVVEEKRFLVGQPHIGPITGKWVAVLSAPIKDDSGRMVGAVHLPLELANFDPQIPSQHLPEASRYGFVGDDGVLIWRNADPEKAIGTRLTHEAAVKILEVRQGEFESLASDSISRFYAVAPVPEAGWVAFIGVPSSAVYAEAVGRAVASAALGILGLGALTLLAIAIARRIGAPVASLVAASRAIRTGNPDVRATPSGPLELATVAEEFNAMVEARLETEHFLQAERDRSQLYLDTVQAIMLALDVDGRITMINQFGSSLLGYRPEDLVGKNWFETCLPLPEGREGVAFYFQQLLRGEAEDRQYFENYVVTADGRRLLVAWRNTLLRDRTGRATGTLSAGEDITQRRAAEEEIHNLAFYDSLTGLPNRRLLLDRLQQSMAASARSAKYRALVFLNLDRFKSLNDTLGHEMGDRLLVQAAGRLQHCVREGDTVSRIGGDEFVILFEQLSALKEEAAAQAGTIAKHILSSLGEPFDLGKENYRGSASVGVTLFVGHEVSAEELLKRADLAMGEAKAAGRDTVRFFDPAMQAATAARVALEKELQRAVAEKQFVLYYQPQVDAAGKCIGVEALIRWQSPERGFVSPAEFIPLAEETGLIVPMGYWVLQEACARLVDWQQLPAMADLTIAVNVSARQFKEPSFVDSVRELILATGISPARLKLEITETMLVDDIEEAVAKMRALKDVGLSFSLDDFGTGYSSLSYVKRLPLDQLKIDQSFVRDILVDHNDAAICRAIIALGGSLGLATIAEGVETPTQWEILAAEGCNAAQGYLYARPMPNEQLMEWLKVRSGALACPVS